VRERKKRQKRKPHRNCQHPAAPGKLIERKSTQGKPDGLRHNDPIDATKTERVGRGKAKKRERNGGRENTERHIKEGKLHVCQRKRWRDRNRNATEMPDRAYQRLSA